MADFYIRQLIGETRAALFDGQELLEMQILRDGDGTQAGTRLPARLLQKMGSRGVAQAQGEDFLLEPWPKGATEGQSHMIEVTRAAWKERGRDRLAKARPTTQGAQQAPGLAARFKAAGHAPKGGWTNALEDAWQEQMELAALGTVRFAGGSLQLVPTPAFVAIDVDGTGPDLIQSALTALAHTIRRWNLGGGLVIDLPQSPDKAARTRACEAFDAAMQGQTFERTAINGFGLLQIIRQRTGPSILERAQMDRTGTAAVALIEQATKAPGTRPLTLVGTAPILKWLQDRPHLIVALRQHTHRAIDLRLDALATTPYVDAS